MGDERFGFELKAKDASTRARRGVFRTPHGVVETPAFMPVGTRGTVKGVQPAELRALGARMLLANTYHLHLRPGEETVRALGGLHRFMNWDGPLLTDSGGYQVFSLSGLNRIDDDGVTFQSVVDGATVRFTPERAVEVQAALGADVQMAFDQCPGDPRDRAGVEQACERTHRWLERCVRAHRELGGEDRGQALFGIVQGGVFEDLRRKSVDVVAGHALVGHAIGGVSVGETREDMRVAVEASAPFLPEDKPRYLMGVGMPLDFFDAVALGVDLFDCVTPTRHGRTHQAFTSLGQLNLRNAAFAHDTRALDPECDCPCCTGFSRGYLRHLCKSNEMLGAQLLTLHNLRYFARLFERIREAISNNSLLALRAAVLPTAMRRVSAEQLE
ncbi:MAG TPA: tRNA guanosine(34) transglycosylase Tgt [Planctomycetota bacterium]|nr:tRNA guanosine(34) transglycosylase Tgt [Planctomycetota bacterium]